MKCGIATGDIYEEIVSFRDDISYMNQSVVVPLGLNYRTYHEASIIPLKRRGEEIYEQEVDGTFKYKMHMKLDGELPEIKTHTHMTFITHLVGFKAVVLVTDSGDRLLVQRSCPLSSNGYLIPEVLVFQL